MTGSISRKARQVVYAIIPAVLLLLAAEMVIRVLGLDKPSIIAGGWARIGQGSLVVTDSLLGWSMRPGFRGKVGKVGEDYQVDVNSLGLRSPEVPAEKGNEFRILSLGESSTFGVGVENEETYSRQLEHYLNSASPRVPVRVINAGVSGWSSTQSLLYLAERGIRLKPDLVIFYHELNDYLPSTIRDTRLTEVETLQTDRQLYRSWLHKTNRILLDVCAVYRFLAFHYSRGRLERLAASRPETGLRANPLAEIGFPENMVSAVANPSEMTDKGSRLVQRFAPEILGRRVSEEERRENLEELLSLCRRNGIRLVLIHPAYVLTLRHECLLTRFCRERSVPMFEAFDSLHHESEEPDFFFVDNFHPSPLGHANLARNLASFVLASFPDLRGGTAASSAGIVPASGWISPDPVPAGGR